ncbi:hypothetical protein [Asinibacterium sp. OR53]|uniref:outer membrane beta-barrel protein n=1 Tax=Asinibacterium sp. OR53 TaxID=925409 RepID=UPI00047E2508|nr:hypothetical protein [Asinibacterium sp. OR53]
MKSKIVLAAVLLFAGYVGKAQTQSTNPLRLGVSVSPGMSLGDKTGFTLGADLRLQQRFAKNVSWILTTGYTHFFSRTFDMQKPTGVAPADISYGFIPLKAGVKAFLMPALYVSGEAGAAYSTQSTDNKFSFVYSPSVGTIIGNHLDLSVKYEDFTISNNTKQLALRVAYGFKW